MGRGSQLQRRELLRVSLAGLSAAMTGCGKDQRAPAFTPTTQDESSAGESVGGQAGATAVPGGLSGIGPLQDPDDNGVRVPAGFSVRIVAKTGEPATSGADYLWHGAPDGGACFPKRDGGWIYASNSEMTEGGGVGCLVFDSAGALIDSYSILEGTRWNCQGGVTPQGTWLSCEERDDGRIFECDPGGKREAQLRPALGIFRHEGVTYDEEERILYLSEDQPDGCLYRFKPELFDRKGMPSFEKGTLEVAGLDDDGMVTWFRVPDPTFEEGVPTRRQVAQSTAFNGMEGIWWQAGVVYFATKGDDRIWAYDTKSRRVTVLYHRETAKNPILKGVDDVIGGSAGELLIAEDGGDMEIVLILADGTLKPLMQLMDQWGSEITGLAFNPARDRLYFSSQRSTGGPAGEGVGITYEMSGPFFS